MTAKPLARRKLHAQNGKTLTSDASANNNQKQKSLPVNKSNEPPTK